VGDGDRAMVTADGVLAGVADGHVAPSTIGVSGAMRLLVRENVAGRSRREGCAAMARSSDELIRLTATEAVARLKRGEITPLDLIDAAERRVGEVEPAINALPTLCFDRAREHARRLMAGEGREAEGEPGWLAGLPVAIKDLADVAGVRTTYGSPIFKDHVPKTSHPVVERIERKGGIVVAKSNTPEFGAGGSTFNEVFGRTRNPWNTALTPGGSTGGGAAALAAGEVWLAHGTDHAGSLRRPPPTAPSWACGPRPAGSRAEPPTTCSRRCQCRDRWRAP
jgi:amidase